MLGKGNVKIREYEFVEIADFDQSRPTLFSKEVNDLGESVFSPQPSCEYELIYFKKISPDFLIVNFYSTFSIILSSSSNFLYSSWLMVVENRPTDPSF